MIQDPGYNATQPFRRNLRKDWHKSFRFEVRLRQSRRHLRRKLFYSIASKSWGNCYATFYGDIDPSGR